MNNNIENIIGADFEVKSGSLYNRGDGLFEGISDRGGIVSEVGSRSYGYFMYTHEIAKTFSFSLDVKRITNDHGRPIELYMLGGCFAISDLGSFYFYESEEHWTGWLKSDHIKIKDWNTIKVVQESNSLIGYVNDCSVGTFELKGSSNFSQDKIAIFFKGDPEFESKIKFKNMRVEIIG